VSRSEYIKTGAGVPGHALTVRDLRVDLVGQGGPVSILDGIDLDLGVGRRMGLVGESGSGKSVTATAMMGLLDYPLRSTVSEMSVGEIDLTDLSPTRWRDVRGPVLSLIQQDPLSALTPVYSVGSQVAAPIRRHLGLSKKAAWAEALDRMAEVGIPDPHRRARDYPHQLSGGLRQRVAIAIALAAEPTVVFADEPTTALDVTVQAQIIDLMRSLSDRRSMSIVFITHDLGILSDFVHDVTVMYSGRIAESGPAADVLHRPRHAYTAALMAAQPGNPPTAARRRLATIPGSPPAPRSRPGGCAFAPRCPLAISMCHEVQPQLRIVDGRSVACHRAEDVSLEAVRHDAA
jgi:oligopeptide/dipeptide ABC transporter ATP-binding protein